MYIFFVHNVRKPPNPHYNLRLSHTLTYRRTEFLTIKIFYDYESSLILMFDTDVSPHTLTSEWINETKYLMIQNIYYLWYINNINK